MKCPECGSKGVTRLKRRRADKWLGYIVPIRPYRCQHCDTHLWGLIRWRHQRSAYVGAFTFWAGITLLASSVWVVITPTTGRIAQSQSLPVIEGTSTPANGKVQRVTDAALDAHQEAAPPPQRTQPPPSTVKPAIDRSASGVDAPDFYATIDRVHLREGAGRQYPSITILDSDRILPAVKPASGEWIQLRHYNATGYVHRSLLKPAPAPEVKQQQG